eukprot:TRINITY_DN8240_c0_g1_i2.p1 TRINITY_DN8240_c0_g1~~TRINITY_DN8240_c0_g1_i2.p1  ORF type:complete len:221 (-),score=33.19 TRINITY_DN8240_c0_g1_i2:58-720(-)
MSEGENKRQKMDKYEREEIDSEGEVFSNSTQEISSTTATTNTNIDTYPQCFEDFWKNGGYVELNEKSDYEVCSSDIPSIGLINLQTFDMGDYHTPTQKMWKQTERIIFKRLIPAGLYLEGPLEVDTPKYGRMAWPTGFRVWEHLSDSVQGPVSRLYKSLNSNHIVFPNFSPINFSGCKMRTLYDFIYNIGNLVCWLIKKSLSSDFQCLKTESFVPFYQLS